MAALHPLVAHFTIALAIVGVLFRLVSLLGRPAFLNPAAATLVVLAAISSVVSVESGDAAHGPVERAPGARAAVVEHEEWGERSEYALVLAGIVELLGLALYKSPSARMVRITAAVVGVVAMGCVYEAAEHGGDLVYAYAGGVGIRSGGPKDVERLLLAGYYHQAMADRSAGRADSAASLLNQAAARFPADPAVQLLAAESILVDGKDPRGALEALAAVRIPDDNRALQVQRANLEANAHVAAGEPNQAIAALEAVVKKFPNPRMQQRIDELRRGHR